MGLRGPPPKSKKELTTAGSQFASERPPDLELPAAKLSPPEGMEAEAAKQWRHVVGLLEPRGALTDGDRMALTVMCELWADDRKLGVAIQSEEPGSIDWKRVNSARNEVRKQLVVMLMKFGLTPADRTRVKVAEKPVLTLADQYAMPDVIGRVG